MGTAVLRPKDCLNDRQHLHALDFRPPPPPPSTSANPRRKNMAPAPPPPSLSPPTTASSKSRQSRPARQPKAKPSQIGDPPQHATKQRPLPRWKLTFAYMESAGDMVTQPRKPLVMEEVRILKRGEDANLPVSSLACVTSEREVSNLAISASAGVGCRLVGGGCPEGSKLAASSLSGVDRRSMAEFGFDSVQNLEELELCYAGAGFFASPSPSSLPIPKFVLRKAGRGGFDGGKAKTV